MNKCIKTTFFSFITLVLLGSSNNLSASNDNEGLVGDSLSADSYRLIWADEFNGIQLDEAKWQIEVNGDGGGNNELQYYRRENVSVGIEPLSKKGCLILTARKEDFAEKNATSGRINTLGKFSFLYGKIEASIKMPQTANGLWPAFWMMGDDIEQVNWPRCGELDIMEAGHHIGIENGTQNRFMNGACHWGTTHHYYAEDGNAPYNIQDDEFHQYTLIWDVDSVKCYLDRDRFPDAEPYFKMAITPSTDAQAPGSYFHKPFFILFNLAVGGHFPKIWDISQITALSSGSSAMYIDYVRVYQQ